MAEFNGVVNQTAARVADENINYGERSTSVHGVDSNGDGVIDKTEEQAAKDEAEARELNAVIPRDITSLLVGITPDKLANAIIDQSFNLAAGMVSGARAIVRGEVTPPETPNTPTGGNKGTDRIV